ncbi:MAG: bifunctional phosphoribosylaminoimidazolecarboxamide formyltransferase/IMP cyclohydrolase [Candidatus Limnocylindrales bacterium]
MNAVRPARRSRGLAGHARIAVGVSGAGSNLLALLQADARGLLAGRIVLVFADRNCPALRRAAEAGVPTALVAPRDHPSQAAWDDALAAALGEARVDLVVLAGFMRVVGPTVLAAHASRILNVHPSLLPAFPGAHAVRDALAANVSVTGVTVHLVDETLDGGPIVAQEAVPVLPDDDEARLAGRLHAVEHRLLPSCVALLGARALRLEAGHVRLDPARAAALPRPRRALVSLSDKAGLEELAAGLLELGFELVSTGGTARQLRGSGYPVTDVADVTGFPELFDGRVKTLHPRIHGGLLADRRKAEHRAQQAAAMIEPFELAVVNLYPFEAAARRPAITLDALIEEIDVGGPAMVRAAAKNHASVAIVSDPAQYGPVLEELRTQGALSEATRRELALAAFRRTAAYDARIAAELSARFEGLASSASQAHDGEVPLPEPAPEDPRLPVSRVLLLERSQMLRYGENPHQTAALYRVPEAPPGSGPFTRDADLRQGKPLSYNNILDAGAAAGLARDLRGPACVIVKHTNPCGVAEADDLLAAWELALAGDPVSAFGGVAAVTEPIDAALAGRLTSIFLEVVVAPEVTADALAVLAAKPNLRVLVDPWLGRPPVEGVEYRSAGGGLLATTSDSARDDPKRWTVASSRPPEPRELLDLELAWRVARHVKSNAIVLVHDGAVVGVGAGQMSRVDSAQLAVAKAGSARARGAACASDAFFPFPDAVETCLAAGVTAFVQPGGSVRDREVLAVVESAGATMLLSGVRHFRH